MARHSCGAPLGGNPSHDVRYYRCPTCRTSVRAQALEDAVWAEFSRLMRNPAAIEQGLQEKQGRGEMEATATASRLDRARRALKANREDEDRLMDAALARTFSVEAIEARVAKVRRERDRILVELAEAEQAATDAQLSDVRLQAIREACATIAGRLDALEPAERHWLLQRMGIQVVWARQDGEDVVDMSGDGLPEDAPDLAGLGLPVACRTSSVTSSVARWSVPVSLAA
jgi:hypothetical protein